jgi:hypothetical protein
MKSACRVLEIAARKTKKKAADAKSGDKAPKKTKHIKITKNIR